MKIKDIVKIIDDNTCVRVYHNYMSSRCDVFGEEWDCDNCTYKCDADCTKLFEEKTSRTDYEGQCDGVPIKLAERTVEEINIIERITRRQHSVIAIRVRGE